MNYYSIKTAGDAFRVTKFDRDLNPSAIYRITAKGKCDCPQALNRHQPCRHQVILKQFLEAERVDSGYMLDYDSKMWLQPLKQALEQSQ